MNQYQTIQLLVALTFVVFGASFILIIRSTKRGGQVPPVIYYGFGVAVLTAVSFWLAEVASDGSQDSGLQLFDVVVKYIRDLPISLIVIYTCLLQVRYYNRARRRDWLNAALRNPLRVVFIPFLCAFVLDLILRPPVLAVTEPLAPFVSAYNIPFILALIGLSWLNAYVFWTAFREPITFPELRDEFRLRLQNSCGIFMSSSLALLATTTATWYIQRATLSSGSLQDVAQSMSTLQLVFIVIAGLAATTGLALHFGQDEYDKIMERAEGLVDPVCDATELLASVPVTSSRLLGPHTFMFRAAAPEREGFLDLSKCDKLKLEDTFRTSVLMRGEDLPDIEQPQVDKDQLIALAQAYDQHDSTDNLFHWLTNMGVESASDAQQLFESGRELSEAINSASILVSHRAAADLPTLPPWAQLAAVALADSGVMPKEQGQAILEGNIVSERVLNAYQAAKLELRNKRSS